MMLKRLLLIFAFLFAASAAHAQGVAVSGIVLSGSGRPVGGATIRICTSAWAGPATISCTPLASIYSDVALTVPITQPGFVTDGLGNYDFFAAAAGNYWVQISGPGLTASQRMYTLQAVAGGSIALSNLNNILFVDGVKYATMAACYAALPSTGGVCVVPPNYTETMAASLTVNKPDSGFIFMGRADITMGSFQVVVTAGTHGVFFSGTIPFGGGDTTTGARFSYSGSGKGFDVGDGITTTRMFGWNNVAVNLTGGAIGAASALYLTNVIYFNIENFGSVNTSASTTTTGLVCDGTGNFCGNGRIANPQIIGHKTSILGTGTGGANGMNAVEISGNQRIDGVIAGSIGIDLAVANENIILSADIESKSIAVRLGAEARGNVILIRSEANTTDVDALAGSSHNTVRVQTAGGSTAVVASDAGTNNHISRAVDGDFSAIKVSDTITSVLVGDGDVLINTAASTDKKFIELANTGHGGFYFGIESSVGGGFFAGTNAYEGVLYSQGNNVYIKTPLLRLSTDMNLRRIKAGMGTALVAGDFGTTPTANWGTGAAYSAIIGTDQGFQLTITAGTTPGANPTIPYTYKDLTWGSSPIFVCKQVGGTGAIAQVTGENTATATTMTLTWNATPVNTLTYIVNCVAIGR
jgi:hypothetical protein